MQPSPPHPLLGHYHKLKQQLDLPLKLRLYLSSFQAALDKKHQAHANKQQVGNPLLIASFSKQSDSSMATFLTQLLTYLHAHLAKSTHSNPTLLHSPNPALIAHIETTAQLETFYFGVPRWLNVKFKLDTQRQQLQISNKKRNIVLELEHYFVRHSQKHKHTMVCEAISKEVSEEVKRVSLYFEQQIFAKVYRQVSECMMALRKEDFLKMATKLDKTEEEVSPKNGQTDPSNVILSSTQITNYLNYKSNILSSLQGNMMFKAVRYLSDCQAEICRSTRNDKIFRLEFPSTMPAFKMRCLFLSSLHNNFKYRVESNQLEEFSKRYRAVYDSYLLGGRICEQISIQEDSEDSQIVHFSQGVETVMTQQHIEFMLVKVADLEGQSKITVVLGVKMDNRLNQEAVVGLLLQCRQMLYRTHNEMKVEEEEEFFSIIDMDDNVVVQLAQDFDYNPDNESVIFKKSQDNNLQQSHLYQHHQISPANLGEQQLAAMRMREHFLLKEWVRCKHGGVMCVRESLAEQRKNIRKVVTSIGANLFKMTKNGGIVNISLPVVIFKKESHLQSIANNFSYAPLLLDKPHRDQLARFKQCILFTISVANLGISSEKPFNPILGETMQGMIGGCPVYVQQISHHPPISAYLFQGRRFRVYGYIEPKIGFYSLNSGKCWTEKPTTIQFDDGNKILLSNPKMIIKGLIFGDREFHYQDKTYIYDTKNHYFAELNFGPKKRGFYYRSDPEDYIHGKIYRTTSAYLTKFQQHIPPQFPTKEDVAVELGAIQGIWSQGIRMDGEEVWNFSTILPYQMTDASHPLPSDSRLRNDLGLYIDGDIDRAQEEKELLQQAQRRDRMLREKRAKA